jgi:hypothetical protein
MTDLSTTQTGKVDIIPVAECITIGRTGSKIEGTGFDDWHINVRQHEVIDLPDGTKMNRALPDISMNLGQIIGQPNVLPAFEAVYALVVAMMAGEIKPPEVVQEEVTE